MNRPAPKQSKENQALETFYANALRLVERRGVPVGAIHRASSKNLRVPLVGGQLLHPSAITAALRYTAHAARIHILDNGRPWSSGANRITPDDMYNAIEDRPDGELRFATAHALLRTAGDASNDTEKLLGRWLLTDGDDACAAVAMKLAAALSQNGRTEWERLLELGWWSVHGLVLVDVILENDGTPSHGRPTSNETRRNQVLAESCAAILATRTIGKSALANELGISRPTLDAWLRKASPVQSDQSTSEEVASAI